MPTAPRTLPPRFQARVHGESEFRLISGGIGHNLPQEDPQAFAEAILTLAEA